MPDTRPKTPSYRLHKPTGQAVVTIGGRDFYLGKHGTKASRDEYDRLVAEWLANGRRLPSSAGGTADLSIVELIAAYLEHAKAYYRKDGRPTSEQACIKSAMRPLRRLYGKTPAAELTPLKLKAVRQVMLEADWSRGHVNHQVDRIKRLFKWAAENELVPAGAYHGLQAVSGLRKGRSEARETEPVRPVPDEYVDAIEPYVSAAVWAMVELQRLTGMRSGEVSIMRGRDLDTSGELWLYRPSSHKTEHHGHERVVELGPRGQAVLSPLLRRNLDAYLFSPVEAESKRNAERRRDRKTPMTPSQARRRPKRKRARAPQDRYTADSYRRAITRGCDRADEAAKRAGDLPLDAERIVPRWHPHQLRHNFGTRIRKQFGLDAARSALGHRSLAMAAEYAELDRTLAGKVALEVG
jgi:integrase